MSVIRIKIRDRRAESPADRIVCGNSDYQIAFDFDEEWNAYNAKTARFIWNNQYVDVVFQGTVCQVPVMTDTILCAVGVFAGDLYTTTPAWITCDKSILCGGGVPAEPTPDVYTQIMALLNKGGVANGLPAGGKAGQVLYKVSDRDYDVEWSDIKIPEQYGLITYNQNKTITVT